MTTETTVTSELLAEFDQPWRGGSPVFACCRRSVATALQGVDLHELAAADVATRVNTLRDVVELEMPGHLEAHRCCVGHLADLAFDLPELVGATATA